ncbi:MAG: hypothetical protein IJY22_04880 [Clostridia bacterium]|nr:hypothetical protein [Clostridia bacterium]
MRVGKKGYTKMVYMGKANIVSAFLGGCTKVSRLTLQAGSIGLSALVQTMRVTHGFDFPLDLLAAVIYNIGKPHARQDRGKEKNYDGL